MTKFPSIWGDINVGHVTAKDESSEAKTKVPAEPDKKEKVKTEIDDDDTSSADVETSEVEVETEEQEKEESSKGKPDPKEKEEEGAPEKIEYSEAEIERAYNLLIDEGILPEPAEGDDFDVTPSGLADATAAAVRKNVAEELAAIPESVQQYYAHVMSGNDPQEFKLNAPINWDDVNLDDDASKETTLKQFYLNQGMSEEDALEEIEDVKTTGKLDKKAEVAREALVKSQTAAKAAKEEKDTKARAIADKKANEEIVELKATIDSAKSIAGFDLDDKRRAAFKDYLFKVRPRTGKTQMQENMANEDRRMNIAFLDFVNYNKEDLTKEITSDLTKTRRKKLSRFSDKGVTSSNSSKSITTKSDSKKGKLVFPTIFGAQSMEVED
jgi:hypothetical protein